MARFIPLVLLLNLACTPLQRATYKAEESHYALYKQKALIVYDVKSKRVLLMNPTQSRCYYLKGAAYAKKWQTGDTMVIDQHLTDFYDLRFAKKCNPR
jgi:hypothetical protein